MAYKKENLRPMASLETSGVKPTMWSYFNEDTDTVTTANFLNKDCGVKAGDLVLVIAANSQTVKWHYATVAGDGKITITAHVA